LLSLLAMAHARPSPQEIPMNAASLMPRLTLRLALPLLGMAALVALADPLPQPAPSPLQLIGAELRTHGELVRLGGERVRHEVHQESREAAERARASAAAMRWLITLPAASGRRCLVDSCTE